MSDQKITIKIWGTATREDIAASLRELAEDIETHDTPLLYGDTISANVLTLGVISSEEINDEIEEWEQ